MIWPACRSALSRVPFISQRLGVRLAHAPPNAPPRLDAATAMETQTALLRVRIVPYIAYRSGDVKRTSMPPDWRIVIDDAIPEFDDHLTGWRSSADPQQGQQCDLSFTSAEAAAEFAARQGWLVKEVEPQPDLAPTRNKATLPGAAGLPYVPYATNFSVRRGGIPMPVSLEHGEAPPYVVSA